MSCSRNGLITVYQSEQIMTLLSMNNDVYITVGMINKWLVDFEGSTTNYIQNGTP